MDIDGTCNIIGSMILKITKIISVANMVTQYIIHIGCHMYLSIKYVLITSENASARIQHACIYINVLSIILMFIIECILSPVFNKLLTQPT